MATGWRACNFDYTPSRFFASADAHDGSPITTPPGAVAEAFTVLSPGRRLAAFMCFFGDAEVVLEVDYDEGDVLWSVEQGTEPQTAGVPAAPAVYELHRIAGGTVAVDIQRDPLGGPGSLADVAQVLLAPEGS